MGEKFIGDHGDGLRSAALALLCDGIVAKRYTANDARGFSARLLRRQRAMHADLDSLRAAVTTELRDVSPLA